MPKPHDPNNIKRLKGDTHKSRYLPDGIKIDKLTEAPIPPNWLDDRAVKLYYDYTQILMANKLIAMSDINTLFMFCKLESAMIELWENDKIPPMAMYSQYKSFVNDFGLSVISREKMPVQKSNEPNIWAKKKHVKTSKV